MPTFSQSLERRSHPVARPIHWLRSLASILSLLLVTNCGAVRQAVQDESASEPVSLSDALLTCTSLYPDQIAMAIARSDCIIQATTEMVRPSLPFPDLLDQENALRKSLAEQVQAGKISLLERNVQLQKLHANLVEQEQERLKADAKAQADIPKEAAVTQWRHSNAESCTKLGQRKLLLKGRLVERGLLRSTSSERRIAASLSGSGPGSSCPPLVI